ncbi:MAG: MBOAT family O-acyltransferase [Clostridia bacterium]
MLGTILVSYICGIIINKFDEKGKYKLKKISFIISLILLLGNLFIFKYYNFTVNSINSIFHLSINNILLNLPIGISFYTFQIISYIVDLYKGKVKVQKNIISLALYISLFPQLIAGPIVRYETVCNELDNRKETLKDCASGLKRFIIGLSKKVLISNQMAVIADYVFDGNIMGTSIVWIAALAYTFQIYFDFSGYSDMAIGLGKMFGFNFLENFNYPYIATSITDFWRRWHISLSTWFRDYVYIPLGGNRVSKLRWIFNILIVWALTGLWHGANWNFIIWGAYFGVILLIEKLILNKILKKCPKFICWFYSMILIIIGWVIFRSGTLQQICTILSNMFYYTKTDWISVVSNNTKILSCLMYFIPAIIFSTPILKKFREKTKNKNSIVIIGNLSLLVLFIVCIVFLNSSNYNPFIYFRF